MADTVGRRHEFGFMLGLVTSDFQEVAVRGQLNYRAKQPKVSASTTVGCGEFSVARKDNLPQILIHLPDGDAPDIFPLPL